MTACLDPACARLREEIRAAVLQALADIAARRRATSEYPAIRRTT